MKRPLVVAALTLLTLVGCAHFFPPERSMPERPLVTIENGRVKEVKPEPLMFPNDRRPVVITWELDDAALRAGFRFAARNGISIDRQIDGPPRDLAQEFSERRPEHGAKQFRVLNKNSGFGRYKYSIRIVDPSGRELPPFDPFIVNQQ